MKHPILANKLGILGIFITALALLWPAHLQAAAGPRPMSICGNLTGADGVVWGRVTEGFQMAVGLDETRLRLCAWIRNPTAEAQSFNSTLLGHWSAVDLEVLGADGEWHRTEEEHRSTLWRAYIGAITDREDHSLQSGEIMANRDRLEAAKRLAHYAPSQSPPATNVTVAAISLPSLPLFTYTNILAGLGITNSPVIASTKTFRDGAVNREVRDEPNWLTTATFVRPLIWREWPAWIFDKPRVTIRITQKLSDASPSNRTFTIESPAIELESDLIRRAIAERNAVAPAAAPVPASGISFPRVR